MKNTALNGLFAAVSALALGGCGGGDDSPAPPPPAADPLAEVPASASSSPEGLAAYLLALADQPSDTREPVDVANVDPPQPDDTEPQAVP